MRWQDIYGEAGEWSGQLIGGPHDKLRLAFDSPPETIVLDGHVYTGKQYLVPEGYLNEGEPMDVTYRYQGKQ
jgi:hypothetical protein